MTEEEILKHCKAVLQRDKSISVTWHLKHYLKVNPDASLIRRIRSNILLSPDYVETTEKEDEGELFRIRQVKRSLKERYPLFYDLGLGVIGGVVGAVATAYLQKDDDLKLKMLDAQTKRLETRLDNSSKAPSNTVTIYRDTCIGKK